MLFQRRIQILTCLFLTVFSIGCLRPADKIESIAHPPYYRLAINGYEKTVWVRKFFVDDAYPLPAPGKSYWVLSDRTERSTPKSLHIIRRDHPSFILWPRNDRKDLLSTAETLRKQFAPDNTAWIISINPLLLAIGEPIPPAQRKGSVEIALWTSDLTGPVQLIPENHPDEKCIATITLYGDWWKMDPDSIRSKSTYNPTHITLSEAFSLATTKHLP